jgi:hypothetical protein
MPPTDRAYFGLTEIQKAAEQESALTDQLLALSRKKKRRNASAGSETYRGGRRTDVLHLRYSEQTACFMVLLKWPIDGPSSPLAKSANFFRTVDATHPFSG